MLLFALEVDLIGPINSAITSVSYFSRLVLHTQKGLERHQELYYQELSFVFIRVLCLLQRAI